MERSWPVVIALAAAALAAGFLLWPSSTPAPVVAVAPPITAGSVTVHVSGEVALPGLVSIPAGSRVADAIVAAGGVLPGADLATLNLAAPVVDGQRVVVPDSTGAVTAGSGDDLVRLNSADAGALEGLPGVGPVLAARIVAYRETHGPFRTVEDLLDVPGIGESKLAAIRDAVIVP